MSDNWYKNGVRILMLIHRHKDGGPGNGDHKCVRRISHSQNEFNSCLYELQDIKSQSCIPYRIYSIINERDPVKAQRLFRRRQLDNETIPQEEKNKWYAKAEKHYISCLAQPECAKEKKFLIDIDEKDETLLQKCIDEVKRRTSIVEVRNTPNGYHLVIEPCNPAFLEKWSVKKDAMILLDW